MRHTLRPVRGVVVLALTAVLACAGDDRGFPSVDGWTRTTDVREYAADNLWEYIDGAAEVFVEYGVQRCVTADLTSGDLVVTVDLYYMGTPLDAFGVYRRERSGTTVAVPGATEAAVSPPYLALMLKGSTFVSLNTVQGELTAEGGAALLEAIARTLPGDAVPPAQLDLLPSEGRVAGTEGFDRDGFLGLAELNDCVYAQYAEDGDELWQGFVMLTGDSSVETVWTDLASEWRALDSGDLSVLYREVPYEGLVGVVRVGETIRGVAGAADEAELLDRLGMFVSIDGGGITLGR